ncbi:transcription initiation factor IIF, beta subunit-domain-containing protein [Russula aff. rugulosa BPL654]|nr:transcription initiation factor IIF, beta subunit-domain-containing protein [Russula aff. rugulosa BPL654]
MDNLTVDDEKKPFDALGAQNDDDSQPDPDEHLVLESGCGAIWLVKIPKFLMERWSKLDTEGVQLAKIRIYEPQSGAPRIVVFNVENQIVVADRAKAPSGTGRARSTIMTGQIKHECNLRPLMTERYERRLMERGAAASEKSMRVRMMDGARAGRGGGKMLSSGITVFLSAYCLFTAGPLFLQRANDKPERGQSERMTRMPHNQLLDVLFALFRKREQWPIKLLREKTQQPEVYLKLVLSEIATLHRSGEFNGTWELRPSFKGDGIKAEGMSQLCVSQTSNVNASMDDYDEEEDDEDEMEEVMGLYSHVSH